MAFFRRRQRPFRKYQPPSSWPEPTVEETVDEALLIALVSVRLALKNLIIVRAASAYDSSSKIWDPMWQ